jgi:hypothetical protein
VSREIPLTQGKVAIVDDCDYPRASKFNWSLAERRGKLYAIRTTAAEGKTERVYLHRYLLDAAQGAQVDHRDGDGLNNRRDNIRLATPLQNVRNRRKGDSGCTASRYKGVFLQARHKHLNKPWFARIGLEGGHLNLGSYHSQEEAALAYNAAAIKYFGEFACLNVVYGPPKPYIPENLHIAGIWGQGKRRLNQTSSSYKGVSFVKISKARPWMSYLNCRGKRYLLGRYATEVEAALAYNEAAKKHFGEFARLNIIEGVSP